MKKIMTCLSILFIMTVAGLSFATSFEVRPPGQSFMFACQAVEVMELENRIHVRCANVQGFGHDQITFIAIDKKDRDKANRFASMATAAVMSGKIFNVVILAGSGINVTGCAAKDCRTPEAFGVAR